jgi:hypothetical protein
VFNFIFASQSRFNMPITNGTRVINVFYIYLSSYVVKNERQLFKCHRSGRTLQFLESGWKLFEKRRVKALLFCLIRKVKHR